jgi:hypothetical protein
MVSGVEEKKAGAKAPLLFADFRRAKALRLIPKATTAAEADPYGMTTKEADPPASRKDDNKKS